MPKISGRINQREREICARARMFREAIKWPQNDFASQIGISLNKLASIEYGRTPLRYDIAWKYREFFGISLEALGAECFPIDGEDLNPWPEPDRFDNPLILLSEVSDWLMVNDVDSLTKSEEARRREDPEHLPPPEYKHRAYWLQIIEDVARTGIASVHVEDVPKFGRAAMTALEKTLEKFSIDPKPVIDSRQAEMALYAFRKEIARRLLVKSAKNSDLTKVLTESNIAGVKPLWPELKRRLQKATAETGKKSELGKFLKVGLTVVSRWLTDKKSAREPGAEYALQMLYWVEHQERQK